MANEITLTARLAVSKNGMTVQNATYTKTQSIESTITYPRKQNADQVVGTSDEALALGDIDITNATGKDYMVLLRNQDAAAIVEVKVKSAATPTYTVIGRMYPGETWGPCRMEKLDASDLGGIYLDSDTADTPVEVVASEVGDPTA